MTVTGATVAGRVEGITAVELDGELVLQDGTGAAVHLLSPTGALVWPLLDGTTSIDDLAADVAEVFSVETAAASADLVAFIDALAAQGLVELT